MTELATFMYQVANAFRQKRTAKLLVNLNLVRPTPDAIIEKMQRILFERLHAVNGDPEYCQQYRQTRQFNPLDKALAIAADEIESAADALELEKPVPKSKRRFSYAKADEPFMHLFSLLNSTNDVFLAQINDIQSPSSKNYQLGWNCFDVKLIIEEMGRYMEAIHVLQYEQNDTPAYEEFVNFMFQFTEDTNPEHIYPYDLLCSAKLEAKDGTTRWLTRGESLSIYPTKYAEKHSLIPDNAVFFEPGQKYKKVA